MENHRWLVELSLSLPTSKQGTDFQSQQTAAKRCKLVRPCVCVCICVDDVVLCTSGLVCSRCVGKRIQN